MKRIPIRLSRNPSNQLINQSFPGTVVRGSQQWRVCADEDASIEQQQKNELIGWDGKYGKAISCKK